MKLGIIFLAGGLLSGINFIKEDAVDRVKYGMPAVMSSLLGAAMLIYKEDFPAKLLPMAAGVCFLFISLYNIINKSKCTDKIKGRYVGAKKVNVGRGVAKYRPRFIYIVSGQTFESITLNSLFQSDLEDMYEEGKTYDIYMNPENNNRIVCKRKIAFMDIVIFMFGVLAIVMLFAVDFA